MTLQIYIDAWQESLRRILQLELDDETGALDTSLPGWQVRDILAHLVHLEEVAAFGDSTGAPTAAGSVSSEYTQAGVDALAEVPVAELLTRLERAVGVRRSQLTPPPTDPTEPAIGAPSGLNWNWETLLRNRALDAWLHEQDIRRVTGQSGGLGTTGMMITVQTFAAALPYVVGKRAGVPAGHAVRFEIEGPAGFDRTIVVGDDGRARETDAEAQTTISMSSETFTRLAGGRESLEHFGVRISGDGEIAARVLANLAITP